jgi:hypothetical protein
MKTTIKPKAPSMSPGHHEKWKTCHLCTFYHGNDKWKTCELKYDSGGTTAPVVGETLTGATSGHTGVVVEVEDPLTGSWAGGDAAGYLTMDTLVGDDDEQGTIFDDDENINGSTAGDNCLTANGDGIVKVWAIMYPKRMLTKFRGHWYCPEHYKFRAYPILRDEDKLIVTEEERGTE